MIDTKAVRALAERAEKYGQSPLGFRKTPHEYALLDSAKHLRQCADEIDVLRGQALSSIEREEYFALKADAAQFRAEERERCAKVCESLLLRVPLSQIPKAIRELGNE